jgi:hypothetical protein
MNRKQLIVAFILVSIAQWLLLGCATPRPTTCLKVVGDDIGNVEYTAQLTF